MNDFENRLRNIPLRSPTPEWREEISASCPAHHAWREELWPSLSAWAALAAVWLVLIAVESFTTAPDQASAPARTIPTKSPARDSLGSLHSALNSEMLHDPFH
jgi:hypothetical protein